MSNWLDLSNVSNILRQSYINGFLDASGPIIGRNDVSFNQKLFVAQDASFGDNIYVKNYVYSATPSTSDNSQKVATTAYVKSALSSSTGSSVAFTVDVSINNRLFIGSDVSMATRVFIGGDLSINGNVNLNGSITVPTPISTDNSKKVATTAYVKTAVSSLTGSSVAFAGDVSINDRLFVGGSVNLITLPRYVTPYSSNATSNSWSNNNITWTASATSSFNSTFRPYYGFNNNLSINGPFGWAPSAQNYSVSTDSYGQYIGGNLTGILGGVGTITGEWLQIQSSSPVILNSFYFITIGYDGLASKASTLPYNFYICGSNDNTNWYPLIYGYWSDSPAANIILTSTNTYSIPSATNTGSIAGTGSNTANLNYTTYGYQTNAYTYFRLVINTIIGSKFSLPCPNGNFYTEFSWSPIFLKTNDNNYSISLYLDSNNVNQLDVSGALAVTNNTNLIGDVSLNRRLFVGSDVSMGTRLFIGGDLSVNGNVNVNGNVTVPTPVSTDNSQKVATTAYVKTALSALTGSSVTFAVDASINNRLFVGGDASFNGNLQLNNIITTPVITSVTPYSSNATSFSWTNNNITWTASASSQYNTGSFAAYNGFNSASTGRSWCSQTQIYRSLTSNSHGQYTGTFSTTILGGVGTISGEWLQIQSSTPVSFNSFSFITCNDGGNIAALIPYNFYICGSSDNTSWYPLINGYWSASPVPNTALSSTNTYSVPTATNTGSIAGTGSNTANLNYTTYGYQTNTYTYFRLVVNAVIGAKFGQTTGNYYAEFFWSPNFLKNTPTATNNSLSINLDSTNVNQLDISGALFVKNNTNLIGDVSMNSRLFLGSDVSMATRLFIGGDLSVNGNVNMNGSVTAPTPVSTDNSQKVATTAYVKSALSALSGSSASFAGDVSINNRLFVGSDASMGGNLAITKNISVSGIVFQF